MDVIFFLLFLTCAVLLIVGLIKPKLLTRFFKKDVTRKKVALVFGGFAIIFFILVGVLAESIPVQESTYGDLNNQKVTENQVNNDGNKEDINNNETESISISSEEQAKSTEETDLVIPVNTDQSPTTIKNEDEPVPTPSETVSQKNAVRSAKSYLGYSAFSHDGLVAQLEYEQFSHADAVYGADNSGADWNEQAAKKAQSYMEYSAFSRGSLIKQLKYEKFTQEQAEYGASAVGL